MSAWRAAHIGFENDGLVIDGVEVWKQPWRSAPAKPVDLPHPAHPHQIHRFAVHDVGDAGHPVRFAACELSNGVWGFYVPVDPPAESRGVPLQGSQVIRHESPDGALRVDLAAVEWSNSHWVNSPRVIEVASGRLLLDLWNTDWDATVSFPGSGRVRLGLRRYRHGGNLALELDLARQAYRIFIGPGLHEALPEAPIADVANGLESASLRAAGMAALESGGHGSSHGTIRRHPFAAWRTALLILAAALIAIAAATLLSIRFGPDHARKLDTVPTMPG